MKLKITERMNLYKVQLNNIVWNTVNILVCDKKHVHEMIHYLTVYHETQNSMMIYDCDAWNDSDYSLATDDPLFEKDYHNQKKTALVISYDELTKHPELYSKEYLLIIDEPSDANKVYLTKKFVKYKILDSSI